MTQSNELLPCPFCGSDNVKYSYQVARDYTHHWVTCYKCSVQVSMEPNQWNTRSTPPQSQNRAVELKQVRDALSSAIKRLETIKETFPAISVDSDIKIYRDALATLDRLSAPVGVPDGYVTVKMGFPNITGSKELVAVPVEFLKSDGSFNKLQTAAPTPAPTEIALDKLATEIMDKYLVGNCEHLQFGDGVVLALREIAATGRLKV